MGDQEIGIPVGSASSGLQVSCEQEHCRARKRIVCELPAAFSFKMSFNCTSRDELYSALLVRLFES